MGLGKYGVSVRDSVGKLLSLPAGSGSIRSIRITKCCVRYIGTKEINSRNMCMAKISQPHISIFEIRIRNIGTTEFRTNKTCGDKVTVLENGTLQHRSIEIGAAEIGIGHSNFPQVCAGQVRIRKIPTNLLPR